MDIKKKMYTVVINEIIMSNINILIQRYQIVTYFCFMVVRIKWISIYLRVLVTFSDFFNCGITLTCM